MSFALVPLIAGLGLLCLAIAPLFDTRIFIFDWLSHFPLQAAVAASGLFLLSLPWWKSSRVRYGLIVLLCAALGNGAWLYPYWMGQAGPVSPVTADITIAQMNVQRVNREFARTLDWVRRVRPDVFVALEVDKAWSQALSELSDFLPYRIIHPRGDNFGLAIYSRFPFLHRQEISLPKYPAPAYLLRLSVAGRIVRLGAIHTLPPLSQDVLSARNLSLEEIGQWAASEPNIPTFVVGDLNVTPFAAPFRSFLKGATLRDPRVGRGLLGTWPSQLPLLFRLPIDYILHNRHVRALSLTAGGHLGSDHVPLVGAFKLMN